ncbi:MAG: hypothetical protein A3G41_04050 [Elusimicrobia bacterium RIFCSPLOWO2_12_FULL_59_9]|nr:MAG: hypothetical protein A3G41_04050 [Elusimicrobia bacterium RIFCSPLOWO2_12_FULL_59_9]
MLENAGLTPEESLDSLRKEHPIEKAMELGLGSIPEAARSFWDLTVRVCRGLYRNYCFDMAAELGFYFLYSFFPFWVFVIALLGTLPIAATPEEILSMLEKFLPGYLFTLAGPTVLDILFKPRHWLALGTLLLALYASSSATTSLMAALNRIYGTQETRAYWKWKGISLLLTAAHAGILTIAFFLLVIVPAARDWLIGYVGFHGQVQLLFGMARWIIAIAVMFFGVALIFSFGPGGRNRLKLVTPGTLVTIAGWLLFSEAFGVYLNNIGPRNLVYGAAGGVIGLLTWLYAMGFMILVGAQVNRELENT